jgi:hypothetical protein
MARLTGPITATPGDSTRRTTTQELPLGTRVIGAGGSEWVYVKAGAAIAQYDPCRFQGSADGYDDVRPTSAAQQFVVGVADAAFASGEYGFIQVRGKATCKVVVGTAAGSLLVTGAVANQLELADATDFAGAVAAVALVTGVAAGSAIVLRS